MIIENIGFAYKICFFLSILLLFHTIFSGLGIYEKIRMKNSNSQEGGSTNEKKSEDRSEAEEAANGDNTGQVKVGDYRTAPQETTPSENTMEFLTLDFSSGTEPHPPGIKTTNYSIEILKNNMAHVRYSYLQPVRPINPEQGDTDKS